jgi:hypothetical protein
MKYIVVCRTVAGQRLGKHIPAQRIGRQQSDNFRCCAMRCKYNSRGRVIFYVVRIYPLLGNGCVFYDYISSSVVNQKSVVEREREREWIESSAVKEEGFGWRFIVSYCNWLWLREIVKEGANKSSHPIQSNYWSRNHKHVTIYDLNNKIQE